MDEKPSCVVPNAGSAPHSSVSRPKCPLKHHTARDFVHGHHTARDFVHDGCAIMGSEGGERDEHRYLAG